MKSAVCLVAILCVSLAHGQGQYRGAVDENIQNVFGSPPSQDDTSNKDEKEIPYDAFDWNLFQTMTTNDKENVLISPFSLKFAMALLYEASGGTTLKQIESVLQFPSPQNETRRKFARILESLREKSDDYILNFASRIYLDDSIRPVQKTGALFNYTYQTEIKSMNVNEAAKSASDANVWVEKITQGRIKNLVSEEDLQDAVIVMLNAIFFKGTWENQFNVSETKTDNFYVTSKKIVASKFMSQTDTFLFYKSQHLDAKILRLPYKGKKYSMCIVLPNTINGLPNLINAISAAQMQRALHLADPANVRVKLPKFQIEYLTKFIPILEEMNIHDLFDSSASLPGFARGQGLSKKLLVSNIIQKSGIDVNELGSTAYSATEVTLVNKFGTDDNNEEFIADKPFLYFIEDETSKQILFMGKIENPASGLSGKYDKTPENPAPKPIQPVPLRPTAPPPYRPQAPSRPASNQDAPRFQYGQQWSNAANRNFG